MNLLGLGRVIPEDNVPSGFQLSIISLKNDSNPSYNCSFQLQVACLFIGGSI